MGPKNGLSWTRIICTCGIWYPIYARAERKHRTASRCTCQSARYDAPCSTGDRERRCLSGDCARRAESDRPPAP